METVVILLNFGEPEDAGLPGVRRFLERIFRANARLEGAGSGAGSDATAAERARELAARRAPGLAEEYRAIGGSPLHAQTRAQAAALEAELRRRGRDAAVVVGMQFADPDIPAAVEAARAAGARRVVALPLYPLCGPSTNLAALEELRAAAEEAEEAAEDAAEDAADGPAGVALVGGWHVHPGYTELRADGVRALAAREGVDLGDPGTALLFSAHGTPLRYLREGSTYDRYVLDHCRRVAAALGVSGYRVGYQNHGNRPGVAWTEPAVDAVMADLDADRVVVVPVSFMQEQSETLYELDVELRAVARDRGLAFHRVPVPHADPRFASILADLAEPFIDGCDAGSPPAGWGACRCRPGRGICCLTHALGHSAA